MEFYREHDVPRRAGMIQVRWQRASGIMFFVLLGFAAMPGWMAWQAWQSPDHRVLAYVAGALAFFLLLMAKATFAVWMAEFRSTNWLLRSDLTGLIIKFRSHRNHHFPAEEPAAVGFRRDEIVWASVGGEERLVQDTDNNSFSPTRVPVLQMQLRLTDADQQRLAEVLAAERVRRGPKTGRFITSSTTHRHYPVTLQSTGQLSVDVAWTKPGWRTLPDMLSRTLPMRTPAVSPTKWWQTARALPNTALDLSQVKTLARKGDIMSATALAQRILGGTLAEARHHVETVLREP